MTTTIPHLHQILGHLRSAFHRSNSVENNESFLRVGGPSAT